MFFSSSQMSESRLTGCALAMVGGGLDAYTYLCRGHVFANAETGNIVLLGLRLAEGDWPGALLYLIPILAFASGVLVAESIRRHLSARPHLHWRQYVVLLEGLILCAVAAIPLGTWDVAANILVAFVCALQVECFRKIHGNALATTMCTGNLRTGTELLFRSRQTGDPALLKKGLEYYLIILFFILGAIGGSLLSRFLAGKTVLVFASLLAVVFGLMFFRPSEK